MHNDKPIEVINIKYVRELMKDVAFFPEEGGFITVSSLNKFMAAQKCGSVGPHIQIAPIKYGSQHAIAEAALGVNADEDGEIRSIKYQVYMETGGDILVTSVASAVLNNATGKHPNLEKFKVFDFTYQGNDKYYVTQSDLVISIDEHNVNEYHWSQVWGNLAETYGQSEKAMTTGTWVKTAFVLSVLKDLGIETHHHHVKPTLTERGYDEVAVNLYGGAKDQFLEHDFESAFDDIHYAGEVCVFLLNNARTRWI